MTTLFRSAVLGVVLVSFVSVAPARATTTETVAAVVAVKLLIGIATLGTYDPSGTSVNTQYALTGEGKPQRSSRQERLYAPQH